MLTKEHFQFKTLHSSESSFSAERAFFSTAKCRSIYFFKSKTKKILHTPKGKIDSKMQAPLRKHLIQYQFVIRER